MKITNSNGSPSEMAQNITNSIQDFASGKVSEEEGLAAIESAISQAISKGLMSPQDVVSISEEALGMGQEETQNFSMKTLGSMQAEKAAAQPKGVMADIEKESGYLGSLGTNLRIMKNQMPSMEKLSEELADLNEEQREIAFEELVQKFQEEKNRILEDAGESAVKRSPKTEVEQDNASTEQDSSSESNIDSSNESASSTDADPVITTGGGSSSDAEAVITTGGGSSDGGEVTITTDSAGTENVEVTTSKKPRRPSAPSLDITV